MRKCKGTQILLRSPRRHRTMLRQISNGWSNGAHLRSQVGTARSPHRVRQGLRSVYYFASVITVSKLLSGRFKEYEPTRPSEDAAQ